MCVTWVSLEIHVCHRVSLQIHVCHMGQSTVTCVSHGSVYSYMCVSWVSLEIHVCHMVSLQIHVCHMVSLLIHVCHMGQSADVPHLGYLQLICVCCLSVCYCLFFFIIRYQSETK